jgi:ABC-type multidrug transport system fused ATPase/permease subunit
MILSVFFCVMIASSSMTAFSIQVPVLSRTIAAARKIFSDIDRHPSEEQDEKEYLKIEINEGRLKFEDVHFSYPTRPGVKIYNGISFEIPGGKITSIIGQSGSGKSETESEDSLYLLRY